MDRRLLAWGLRRSYRGLPRLWLFTDERRLPDPRAAIARLPRGQAGVVLRHDTDPCRRLLGNDIARICRARRLVLVVAGDGRLASALRAGVHLRAGRWPDLTRSRRLLTSSAHSAPDLKRAARAGASLAFLSPAFPTASHPGAAALGPLRWGLLSRRRDAAVAPINLGALGGIDGLTVRRLPPRALKAVGAITALAQSPTCNPAYPDI